MCLCSVARLPPKRVTIPGYGIASGSYIPPTTSPITAAFTGVLRTYSEWDGVAQYRVTRKLNTDNICTPYLFLVILNLCLQQAPIDLHRKDFSFRPQSAFRSSI